MASEVLKAERRNTAGTKAARRVRRSGRVPAIIYGKGIQPTPVSFDKHDLLQQLHHGAHLLDVELDGKVSKLLLKDVQYDHLGNDILHVDLARVDLRERIVVTVPIELRGTAPGIDEGGILEQHLTELEVECLVTRIPEVLRPSVTKLHVGDVLYAKDVELPEGVTLVTDPDEQVVSVRTVKEEVVAEEPEAAEPEVIGRKPSDEQQEEQE